MPRLRSPEPPAWWNPSLYDFVNDMPLEGWAWEFYRRAVLKENLPGLPVDAMNPTPDLQRNFGQTVLPREEDGWVSSNGAEEFTENGELASENWNLYFHWGHPDLGERKRMGTPSSVSCKEVPQLSRWFGRQYTSRTKLVGKTWLRKQVKRVTLTIDIDRRDSVIRRDFESLFAELRKKYPESERVSPRIPHWVDNRILQVWDLREFKVGWNRITNLFFTDTVELYEDKLKPARNAYYTAKKLIEGGDWLKLALYADLE